jgi:hypothetical protein
VAIVKKIVVGFSTTNLPLSKLIRFFQGTNFSHSYLQYESTLGNPIMYQASGMNTHLVNKRNVEKHAKIVEEYEIEVNEDKFNEIKAYIENDIGIPYGWGEVFGLALGIILRKLSFGLIKVKNVFPSDEQSICSEAVGYIYINFLGGKKDLQYDDMDLIWLINKIKNDNRFKRIK